MTLDPAVFKAYDVRGLVPDQLDADGAYRIARAFVEVFQARRIAIGHDMRLSSPELAAAAVRGATDGGDGRLGQEFATRGRFGCIDGFHAEVSLFGPGCVQYCEAVAADETNTDRLKPPPLFF